MSGEKVFGGEGEGWGKRRGEVVQEVRGGGRGGGMGRRGSPKWSGWGKVQGGLVVVAHQGVDEPVSGLTGEEMGLGGKGGSVWRFLKLFDGYLMFF